MLFGSAYPDPIAISIGAFGIRWYALCLLVGMGAGILLIWRLRHRINMSESMMWDAVLISLFSGIIGSRVAYVLSHLSLYPTLLDTVKLWEGGMAIHGGLIAGTISLTLYCWKKRISFFSLTDVLAPALALGQAIGRWGNYFNQEVFGPPTTLPWGVPINPVLRPERYMDSVSFHPVWLYESIWNLFIFAILIVILRKFKAHPGVLTGLYVLLYYLGRFVLEFFRMDVVPGLGITVGQWVSIGAILAAGVLIVMVRRRNTPGLA